MRKRCFPLVLACCFSGFHAQSQSYIAEKQNPKIKVKPVVPVQAWAFNLKDVRLLHGSPFKNAMDRDGAYLLTLETGRLLHRFYKNAGLADKRRCIWRMGKRRIVGSYPGPLSFCLCNDVCFHR